MSRFSGHKSYSTVIFNSPMYCTEFYLVSVKIFKLLITFYCLTIFIENCYSSTIWIIKVNVNHPCSSFSVSSNINFAWKSCTMLCLLFIYEFREVTLTCNGHIVIWSLIHSSFAGQPTSALVDLELQVCTEHRLCKGTASSC